MRNQGNDNIANLIDLEWEFILQSLPRTPPNVPSEVSKPLIELCENSFKTGAQAGLVHDFDTLKKDYPIIEIEMYSNIVYFLDKHGLNYFNSNAIFKLVMAAYRFGIDYGLKLSADEL